MLKFAGVAQSRDRLPEMPREYTKVRPSDGRRMPATFNPVAIVHDAGEWYFYEDGDQIPDRHKPAGEAEVVKS